MTREVNSKAISLTDTDVMRSQIVEETIAALRKLESRIDEYWRTSKDKQVQMSCGDVKVFADFVARCLASLNGPIGAVSRAVRRDERFFRAFKQVQPAIDDFGSRFSAVVQTGLLGKEQIGPRGALIKNLADAADDLRTAFDEALNMFIVVVDDRATNERSLSKDRVDALQIANDTRNRLRTQQILREAQHANDEAQHAKDAWQEVAGNAGATELGTYYEDYAKLEAKRADRLRQMAAGLLALITAGAMAMNFLMDEVSVATELVRLSAAIPIGVLAGYLVRESSNHRKASRWARELAMALHSLPSYVEPMNDNGTEMRHVLGVRVFGAPSENGPAGEDGLFDDLPKAVGRVEEILQRIKEMIAKREGR